MTKRKNKLILLQLELMLSFSLILRINAQNPIPDNHDIYAPAFEIGVLNGKPANVEDALINNEFFLLSAEGSTVQVKKKEEFPQKLLPGQRIAVFLENLSPANYYLHAFIGSTYDRKNPDMPALAILFNHNWV